METAAEAFLLLSLPKCTLSVKDYTETSPLGLQCVTVPLPDASNDFNMNVYLVLRLNMSETPIDPARIVHRTTTHATRVYTFNATSAEPDELVLTVSCPPGDKKSSHLHEDLETFESILEQYAIEFRCSASPGTQTQIPSIPPPTYVNDQKNLHGHLVMINEDTGEIVGEVEDRFRIQEDPMMYQQGHENDPVVIEVPDEGGLREEDANALAAFARIVPPDEQDWITKSATVVSRVISSGTNLLITTITTASNYYITKSNPSPHHSSFKLNVPDHGNAKRQTSPLSSRSHSPTPPPLPPRALVFLTSDRTRKNLRAVHAVSGQAVKVSAKTVKTIDNMIRRAMGARPKENRLGYNPAPAGSLSITSTSHTDFKSPLPPRPNIYTSSSSTGSGPSYVPPLPPRSFPPSPSQPSSQQYQQQNSNSIATLPAQPKLTTTRRLLISADLILSTIDDSTRKLLDSGTTNLGRVVHHKYGAEAAESSLLMAGTARNIGLVYIDMSGMGRRALLRRAGMSFVKSKVQNREDGKRPVPPIPTQK